MPSKYGMHTFKNWLIIRESDDDIFSGQHPVGDDATGVSPENIKQLKKDMSQWEPDFGEVLRWEGRDFIAVDNVPGYGRLGFYRSTGRNSGRPNTWFPCDGISFNNGGFWINKQRFGSLFRKDGDKKELNRLGQDDKLANASEALARESIGSGKEVDALEINKMIGTRESQASTQMLKMVQIQYPDLWEKALAALGDNTL